MRCNLFAIVLSITFSSLFCLSYADDSNDFIPATPDMPDTSSTTPVANPQPKRPLAPPKITSVPKAATPVTQAAPKSAPIQTTATKIQTPQPIKNTATPKNIATITTDTSTSDDNANKGKALSLSDAIWLALRYNPNIQNSQIDRVTQKYNLLTAKNQFELQYALNGSSTMNYSHVNGAVTTGNTTTVTPSTSLTLASGANINANLTNTINGAPNGGTYNPALTVSVTQPLMRGFGSAITLSPLANAYDSEKINQLNLRQTIINTIVKITGDYYAVIQSEQNLKTQKLALDDVATRFKQNEIKINAGKIPASDNMQSQTDLAQAELAYNSAKNSLLQSKFTLLNDIGLSPDEPINIIDNLDIPNFSIPDLEVARMIVLANDPTYQTALINRRIDERAVKTAEDNERAQLNLTISGTTGTSSGGQENARLNSLINGSNQNASVGLSLSVPIDDMNLKQATLAAKARVREDDINLKNSAWLLDTNTINTINNLITLKKQLDLAKIAVDTQARVLTATEIKYKFGMASSLDVSLQQSSLTTTRLNYINTEINYLNTLSQFRQMLGKTLEDWHVEVRY